MNILAVDTSTPQVTAGIVHVADDSAGRGSEDGDRVLRGEMETLAQQLHLDARAHNEVLVPLIQQCLADAELRPTDLDAVIVGCGPGPFTGLRVGMATAASFADALGIACHGICSLDALATDLTAVVEEDSHVDGGASDELVVTDARRREVYFAAYRAGRRVFGPAVAKPQDVMGLITAEVSDFAPRRARGSRKHIEQILELHPSEAERESAIEEVAVEEVFPTPAAIVRAAIAGGAAVTAPASPLVPLYLRRPDATIPKVMR